MEQVVDKLFFLKSALVHVPLPYYENVHFISNIAFWYKIKSD